MTNRGEPRRPRLSDFENYTQLHTRGNAVQTLSVEVTPSESASTSNGIESSAGNSPTTPATTPTTGSEVSTPTVSATNGQETPATQVPNVAPEAPSPPPSNPSTISGNTDVLAPEAHVGASPSTVPGTGTAATEQSGDVPLIPGFGDTGRGGGDGITWSPVWETPSPKGGRETMKRWLWRAFLALASFTVLASLVYYAFVTQKGQEQLRAFSGGNFDSSTVAAWVATEVSNLGLEVPEEAPTLTPTPTPEPTGTPTPTPKPPTQTPTPTPTETPTPTPTVDLESLVATWQQRWDRALEIFEQPVQTVMTLPEKEYNNRMIWRDGQGIEVSGPVQFFNDLLYVWLYALDAHFGDQLEVSLVELFNQMGQDFPEIAVLIEGEDWGYCRGNVFGPGNCRNLEQVAVLMWMRFNPDLGRYEVDPTKILPLTDDAETILEDSGYLLSGSFRGEVEWPQFHRRKPRRVGPNWTRIIVADAQATKLFLGFEIQHIGLNKQGYFAKHPIFGERTRFRYYQVQARRIVDFTSLLSWQKVQEQLALLQER